MFCDNPKKLGRDDGTPLQVLLITRASDRPPHWERMNHGRAKDQEAVLHNWVAHNVFGPTEITVLNLEEKQKIDFGGFELIVASSLDRIGRDSSLVKFVQQAVEAQIRIVAVQDGFDSSSPNWMNTVTLIAMRNSFLNELPARSIRRARRKGN